MVFVVVVIVEKRARRGRRKVGGRDEVEMGGWVKARRRVVLYIVAGWRPLVMERHEKSMSSNFDLPRMDASASAVDALKLSRAFILHSPSFIITEHLEWHYQLSPSSHT